jgi:hypothetical protein
MTVPFASRDGDEVEAMATDRYLDALLAAHAAGAGRTPASSDVDPLARFAAERLSHELPRLHPSFRFEEGLWLRLADVARAMRPVAATGSHGTVLAISGTPRSTAELVALAAFVDGKATEADTANPARPLIVGGALTSAALSLAGAVYVAWRLSHPNAAPMARAVRAVGRTRLA